MAQLIGGPFNAHNVDPSQGLPSLPIGRHPVIIESSEIKANSKNDGGYLQFGLRITDGPAAGQTGAYRLNLYNNSPDACNIAQRQLSAVCHVTGVYNVEDTAALHNIPFVIEVGYQRGHEPGSNPEAKGYTEVKRVFDINGNEPGKQGQNNANPAPANNANTGQQNNGNAGGGNGAGWGGGNNANAGNGVQNPAWGQNNGGNNNANAGGNNGNSGGGWQQNNGGNAGGNANGGAPWGQR